MSVSDVILTAFFGIAFSRSIFIFGSGDQPNIVNKNIIMIKIAISNNNIFELIYYFLDATFGVEKH